MEHTTFAPMERMNLGSRVYQRLREALMHGELKPGEIIRLRETAAKLDTSTTPVREALQKLVAENVLEVRANGSIYVPSFDKARFEELVKMRLLLEREAALSAFDNVSTDDIDRLIEIHKMLDSASNFEERSRQNRLFHFYIYDISGMPILVSHIETVWLRIGPLNHEVFRIAWDHFNKRQVKSGEERVHPHEDIIKGMRERDSEILIMGFRRDIIEAAEIANKIWSR